MKISVSGVILLIHDIEASAKFYEALGFEVRKRVPKVSVTACLDNFWIEMLLSSMVVTEEFKNDVAVTPKGAGQYIHFQVEDVDEFFKYIVEKELSPASKPQDFPWGNREFVIIDPDGYKLVFFNTI